MADQAGTLGRGGNLARNSPQPEANDLTVGVMALVAQAERETIFRRTKAALAMAKTRGVKLGHPNGCRKMW